MTKMFMVANLGFMSLIMAQTDSCMINVNLLGNLTSPDDSSGDDNINNNGDDDTNNDGGNLLNLLAADLSSMESSTTSRVRYEVRSDQTRFDVEVESGVPNAILDIVVDGVTVDQLTLNDLGFGEVEYRDPPDNNPDANEFPFPEGFPEINEGTVVMVGDLTGIISLVASNEDGSSNGSDDDSSGDDNGNSNGDDDTSNDGGNLLNLLTADLSTMGSSTTVRVLYEVRSDQTRFDVEVESGVPNAILDIVVDGVTVDQLTLNDLGFGEVEYRDPPDNNPDANEFPFPDNMPAVQEGTIVEIGTLSGVMAP